MKKMHTKIVFVKQDKGMLHYYRMREKAIYDINDYNSRIRAAEQISEERRLKKELEEGRQEIFITYVVNAIQEGLSVEQISRVTDQTVEEVVKTIKAQGLA
ncbi:MAG: hypothetical protein LBS43_09765 [Prevotellaceae bacterium]|jgi:hypothetical protein|nr:hypothetical protein [Prevotellaceae bacterium]